MSKKFELDKNGHILDSDPIYEDLYKWHENDEYDKILETIYAIPHKYWSNRLWFRVISALNNKKEFDKARIEIEKIKKRCESPADQAKLYYMLGYGFYMEDKEIKALNLFHKALKVDPDNTAELDLYESCKDCEKYINRHLKKLDSMSYTISEMINEFTHQTSEEDKEILNEDEFIMMLSFIPSIRRCSNITQTLQLEDLSFKYDDEQKKLVKEWLRQNYGVKNSSTLSEAFETLFHIGKRFDDIIAYTLGKPNFDLNELSEKGFQAWNAGIMFAEKAIRYAPKGGLMAWDISEKIGLARHAYACDLISKNTLISIVNKEMNEAIKRYSSWEEYLKSVVFGAGFFMFFSEDFNIVKSIDFMQTITSTLLKSDIAKKEWHNIEKTDS